jgi:hypothetical protein
VKIFALEKEVPGVSAEDLLRLFKLGIGKQLSFRIILLSLSLNRQ